ncbi:MAG: hypothetical protein M0C28_38750 [Candidatus Moduliflexus flocculans]|nr:hypothetical protein [Candidatus Moduliflexus flocculans]
MNRIRNHRPLVIFFVLVVAGAAYAQQVTKVAIINSQKAFETCAGRQEGPDPDAGPRHEDQEPTSRSSTTPSGSSRTS